MKSEHKQFLQKLLSQSAPSGFEEPIQKVWVERTKKYADLIKRDVMGNAIAILNPQAKFKVMLAGHCDEIGFIVTHISEKGYIYIEALGGIDKSTLPGTEVWIQTDKDFVKGIIGKKAIHLEKSSERGKVSDIKDVFIDIGAKNKKEALKKVEVGNTVTFKPNYLELNKDIISSKACDDRAGSFIVSEVIRILSEKRTKLNVGVYGVSTVQEETGLRGATISTYGIAPDVGIAIDVTHSSDVPNLSETTLGNIELGKGVVIHPCPCNNVQLYKLAKDIAKKKKIKHQVQASGYAGGTDTEVMQLSKDGVATMLLSIPVRYMHTPVETMSIKDIESTINLIVETILKMNNKTNFLPKD